MKKQTMALTTAGMLALGMSAGASANVIDADAMSNYFGESFADLGFATVSINPEGPTFAYKEERDGIDGFGTDTNPKGEISGGETIRINFNESSVIGSLSLAFLWPEGVANDDINESANLRWGSNSEDDISPLGAEGNLATLTALGGSDYEWTGENGTVTQISGSTSLGSQASAWQISNPFGNEAIDWLEFEAPDDMAGSDGSDFAISSVAVPNPAALGLLGLGLLGVAAARRFGTK